MRLIDAEAFDNELRIQQIKYDVEDDQIGYKLFEAMRIDLSHRPTIDAAPVRHGKWINSGYACGENKYICSVCGENEWRTNCRRMKYCMFCGAKMDLE